MYSIKIANRSFEDAAKLKYLETTLTDKNCLHEGIKSRLISGNVFFNSVQRFLSYRLLSRNVNVKVHKLMIVPVVLCRFETRSLTLTEEHRLRVFERWVLRKIFGSKRDEVTGEWRKLHSGELYNLYSSLGFVRQIKSRRMWLSQHVARLGEERNF
jgi:hypothetical protein